MKLMALGLTETALLCVFVLMSVTSFGKTANIETPAQIFKQVSPSVVVVHVLDSTGKGVALGSGVVIGRGVVITNCHVAEDGQRLEISHLKTAYTASVRYADPDRDLCELSVPKLNAPPVTFGNSQHLEVGQRVYAVGAPEGLELTLSEGLISSVRSFAGLHFIQTSASISPGSSGGGLFDDHGRLVGITTFYVTGGQNLNFALPADWIHGLPERAKTEAQMAQRQKKMETAWLLKGDAYVVKQDWQGLLRLSLKWTTAEPRSALAWGSLGVAYVGLLRYGDAVKASQDALGLDPDNPGSWLVLAYSYQKLGRYNKAIDAYQRSLRLGADYARIWENLGTCYGELSEYDQSVGAFRQAIRLNPRDLAAWDMLGFTYYNLGKFEAAVQSFREVIRQEPKDAFAWGKLGASYGLLKEYEKAEGALREAVLLDPRNSEAWGYLGATYCATGQKDKAIDVYQRLQTLDPKGAKTLFNACIAP